MFIDNPIGVGISFAENISDIPTDQKGIET